MPDAVDRKPFNVLFLCTGNSARSIMAEAILDREGRGKFRAFSAGSHPKGSVHPYALDLLRKLNFDVGGFRSKSWSEFARPDAPKLDFVFTVCDDAAAEACPVWPGQPMTAHWGIPDPAAATGNEAEIRLAFADAFRMLNNRISIFVNLPIDSLDRLALQKHLDSIGKTQGRRRDAGDRRPNERAVVFRSPGACWRRRSAPPSWSPRSSAPASWPSASPAETRRSRCSATRSRPARSWW